MSKFPKKQSKGRADYVLLGYFLVIVLFGLLALMSASSVQGFDRFGDSYYFVKRQILYGLLPGLLAFLIFAKFDYKKLHKMRLVIYALMLLSLGLVFIPPIGTDFGTHAYSWLHIGSYSVQPAEFAKLGLILVLASFLADKGKELENLQTGFLPALILGIIPVVMIVQQPDVGTSFILFAIVFGLLFLARAKMSHIGMLLAAGAVTFIVLIAKAPYRMARFMTFLHPELDPQGKGYHINQAYLAIGSGGWFGLGLGHSRQKFQYLPEVHADSIFAVIAEETGFVVSSLVIILVVLIAMRGLGIAKNSSDEFGRLLVCGIVIWFVVQSFMNIAAMIGLMPITGVPLLFISHGGTALITALAAAGILINVSKQTKS